MGLFDSKRPKSALMRDRAYKSNEPHEQAYVRKTRPKNPRYMANGGGVGEYEVGDIVMISPDNDNENYEKFVGKKLKITHKATNKDEHRGYDEGVSGGLYDLVVLSSGKEVPFSLYDYELVSAYADGGSMADGGRVDELLDEITDYESVNKNDIPELFKEEVVEKGLNDEEIATKINKHLISIGYQYDSDNFKWVRKSEYADGGGVELPYYVYNYETKAVEKYFDNEIEAEEFAVQFENAEVYRNEYADGRKRLVRDEIRKFVIPYLKDEHNIEVDKSLNDGFNWFVPAISDELPDDFDDLSEKEQQEFGTHLATDKELIDFARELGVFGEYADGGMVESIKNKVKKLTGDDLDTYKFFIREGDTEERAWQGVLDGRKDRKKHKSNEDFYRRAYEMKDGGSIEENKRMAVETFLGGLTNDELYYVANEYADLDWDDDANLDNQIQMWIKSLSNEDINMLHEELLGYKRGGKVDVYKYNLSFQYNPSIVKHEYVESIVEKYTKDWKHNNDWDEVSFYVLGLTKDKSENLKRELKMEDVYNVEIDESQYKRGGKVDGRSTRAKSTWNSGGAWTRDRNAHNKSEDWEKPMNKRGGGSSKTKTTMKAPSKSSTASTPSKSGKSKYSYIPNSMLREAEVENKGKTTYIDGADILDGIYVKKGTKYADGGGVVKKYNYVPNRMIQAIEVERNGKTTEIDGANILDGIYVKGKVKYADGGMADDGEIKSMKEMMDSCYTYGGLDKGSYNYERYILPYKGRLGEKMFDKVYNQYSDLLKSDYEVEGNTYTDSEGLTYNTLKKKYAKGSTVKGDAENWIGEKNELEYADGGQMDYGSDLTDESTVRGNITNGEIHCDTLTEIIGCEPNYPCHNVGSLKLTKCFLRPYYKIG